MRRLGLILVALLLLVGSSSCNKETPAPAPPTPVTTWTPTATIAPDVLFAPALTPAPSPETARQTTSASVEPPITPVPCAVPSPANSHRIDSIGPEPVPTISPLPQGRGRPPVHILIPAAGLDAPVQPMRWRVAGDHTEWVVPNDAAGWHIDSAFPGEKGNVVISGHHNIGGSVFAGVSRIGEPDSRLGLGDEIILEDDQGRRFVYRITGWRRIPEDHASVALRQENASYLLPTDFPQLTLITCWPADNNTHRVIVQAALTEIRTP